MDGIICDYADCLNVCPKEEMTQIGEYFVCPDCTEKVEDHTGYCSASCQCGYGCDDSC